MRIGRNIFATAFAVVLASGFAACEPDNTEFEETPPAEEIDVFDEEPAVIEQEPATVQPAPVQPAPAEPGQTEPIETQPSEQQPPLNQER